MFILRQLSDGYTFAVSIKMPLVLGGVEARRAMYVDMIK